jgi:hypothetical protein
MALNLSSKLSAKLGLKPHLTLVEPIAVPPPSPIATPIKAGDIAIAPSGKKVLIKSIQGDFGLGDDDQMYPMRNLVYSEFSTVQWSESDYKELADLVRSCIDKEQLAEVRSCFPRTLLGECWRFLGNDDKQRITQWLK